MKVYIELVLALTSEFCTYTHVNFMDCLHFRKMFFCQFLIGLELIRIGNILKIRFREIALHSAVSCTNWL